jgi:hypothetical protein
MKKVRRIVGRNARELAKVLGLTSADGLEIEFGASETPIQKCRLNFTHGSIAAITIRSVSSEPARSRFHELQGKPLEVRTLAS